MEKIKMPLEAITVEDLESLLWDVYELFDGSKNEIGNLNKTWKVHEDLRLLVFDHFRSTVQNCLYSLIFVKESLSKIEWWHTTKSLNTELTKIMTRGDVQKTVEVYVTDIKINLVFNTFKNLEVFMRDLCRNIDKTNICNSYFYCVRDKIIEDTGLNCEFENFIKLFQCIRNTMHNNGFHFAHVDPITYKGISYNFKNGEPLTFLDLNFIRLLLNDTNDLLLALITSEKISEKQEMISLYSKIDFVKY